MMIEVNGVAREVAAATVAEALAALGFGEAKVATALNGGFVPVAARAGAALSPGDRLEILTAMQGG